MPLVVWTVSGYYHDWVFILEGLFVRKKQSTFLFYPLWVVYNKYCDGTKKICLQVFIKYFLTAFYLNGFGESKFAGWSLTSQLSHGTWLLESSLVSGIAFTTSETRDKPSKIITIALFQLTIMPCILNWHRNNFIKNAWGKSYTDANSRPNGSCTF